MKKLKVFLRKLLNGSVAKKEVKNPQLYVRRVRKARKEQPQPEEYHSPGLILA